MSEIGKLFVDSWSDAVGRVHSNDEILKWVAELNASVFVDIKKIELSESNFWFYDVESGCIVNKNRSFFQVAGLKCGEVEQPILLQDEIGYLGILCKVFDGILHFLMQAKIEPGNINKIQLSPTIQATKSNFTQKHGGSKPPFLDCFLNAAKHTIIADQIQSEQSSRFLGKRNRNIIVMLGESEQVECPANFKWLTLGQIKRLMRVDNLVNMDTRTVLSCIPFCDYREAVESADFADGALARSILSESADAVAGVYHSINNYKMFDETVRELVPLFSLKGWEMRNGEYVCRSGYSFKVVFRDITIDGREVKRWTQPLFEATAKAAFVLLTRVNKGVTEFLVRPTAEIGCFDKIELGPSFQSEDGTFPPVEGKVLHDVMLSEEGGRFYHEQNRNVIIEVSDYTVDGASFWVTYGTLNRLAQVNNCLNIQLRNLLSLLEIV